MRINDSEFFKLSVSCWEIQKEWEYTNRIIKNINRKTVYTKANSSLSG